MPFACIVSYASILFTHALLSSLRTCIYSFLRTCSHSLCARISILFAHLPLVSLRACFYSLHVHIYSLHARASILFARASILFARASIPICPRAINGVAATPGRQISSLSKDGVQNFRRVHDMGVSHTPIHTSDSVFESAIL